MTITHAVVSGNPTKDLDRVGYRSCSTSTLLGHYPTSLKDDGTCYSERRCAQHNTTQHNRQGHYRNRHKERMTRS
jgi:hypothetical protein